MGIGFQMGQILWDFIYGMYAQGFCQDSQDFISRENNKTNQVRPQNNFELGFCIGKGVNPKY